MVNKPLIRPYFWGGYVRGGRLTSHDNSNETIFVLNFPLSDIHLQDGPLSPIVKNGGTCHPYKMTENK